jgi:enamine deaminase RidA (YjgF/YER057c/UK114 family)
MSHKSKQISPNSHNNSSKIPNTGHIVEIVASIVQSLNTLVDIIDNSSFKNPGKTVKKIEKTSDAVLKSINILGDTVGLIQSELSTSKSSSSNTKSTASILSNPYEFIKSIKEKKLYKSKEPNLILHFYNIVSLLAQIGDLQIDSKHIKQLIKNTKDVLSDVINLTIYVNKKAAKYNTLNKTALAFLKTMPATWDLLAKSIDSIQLFCVKCKQLDPKVLKEQINNIMKIYSYLMFGCVLLISITGIKSGLTPRYVDFISGLTVSIVNMLIVLTYLTIQLSVNLDKIGQHRRGIRRGIKAFSLIFGRKRLFRRTLVSTIMDIELPEELKKKTIELVIIAKWFLILTYATYGIAIAISMMGKMLITTIWGLWVMKRIIIRIIDILTDKKVKATKSTKEKTIELVIIAKWFLILTYATYGIAIAISMMGKMLITTIWGLWVMKRIIIHIIDILTDKKVKVTKSTKEKASEIAIIVGLFTTLSFIMAPLALIGLLGGLSIYFAVLFMGLSIKYLVRVFVFVNKANNQKALAKASGNLGLLKAANVILLSIITDTILCFSKLSIGTKEIENIGMTIAVCSVLLFIMIYTMNILGSRRVKKIVTKSQRTIATLLSIVTALTALLNAMVSATKNLTIKKTLYVVLFLFVVITSLIALCWVVGRKRVKKLLSSTGASVILLTAIIEGFAKVMKNMEELTSKIDFKKMTNDVMWLSFTILILLGFFIVVGFIAKQSFKQVAKSILVIGMMTLCVGSILIISYALMLISRMPVDPKNIGCVLLSILMLTGTMIVFGLIPSWLLLPALVIASMMTLISIALISMCVSLVILAKFDINTLEKAKENAVKVFEVTSEIIRGFMYTSVLPENKSDNKFSRVMQFIGGSIAQIVEAFSCMVTILFMMVAIVAIMIIAAMLEMIQDIKLNPKKIKENIQKIFDIVNQIIQFLVDPESDINKNEPENKGVIGTLLGWFSPNLVHIWDAICVFVFLLMAVLVVGAILAVGNMLEHIQKLNINSTDITAVVNDLFSCVKLLNDKLAGKETVEGAPEAKEEDTGFLNTVGNIFGNIIEGAVDFFKRIGGYISIIRAMVVIGALYFLSKSLNFIQTIDINEDAIKAKTDLILNTYNSVCETINGKKLNTCDEKSFTTKTKQLNTFINSIQKFADATNDIDAANVKPFMDVMDKACSIDVDSVKTVTKLFEQMTRFSTSINGNIKMLADTLSGDLLDAIKELNDCLGQSKDVVVENNVNSSDIGKTEGEVIKEQNKETKEYTKANTDLSEVTDRMDQIKTSLKQLQIALDDIKSGTNGFSFR